ncbi:hypothetical protein [Geotalea daltonii]|uniref:hypothetical protein n=1 Tax=Geotalea daltonii TaxID=1203471 RepID=UPI0012B64CBD|nr:hypothetical protein [Geotalea daltonii]
MKLPVTARFVHLTTIPAPTMTISVAIITPTFLWQPKPLIVFPHPMNFFTSI